MTTTRSRWLLLLFLASAFGIPSCASGPPPGPSPERIAGLNAKTILVAPFNIVSALPPELEGSTKMVSRALVEHLEAHGKTVRVIGFRSGQKLWKDSVKEVRNSGAKRNFENAARVYTRKIGEQIAFDALIIPSIFIQNAKMRGRTVRWDGAKQMITIKGSTGSSRYQGSSGTLNVRAASIFVRILGHDGDTIQTKRSGLELIQHLEWSLGRRGGHSGTDRLSQDLVNDSPPIEDDARVRAGVAAALSPFLPEKVPDPVGEIPERNVIPEETGDAEPS